MWTLIVFWHVNTAPILTKPVYPTEAACETQRKFTLLLAARAGMYGETAAFCRKL